MIRITGVKAPLTFDEAFLRTSVARALKLAPKDVLSVRLSRRSVDARDKGNMHFSLNIDASVRGDERAIAARCQQASIVDAAPEITIVPAKLNARPVIAGLGPAGLFAGLTLALAGARPIILERGRPVDERARDVDAFRAGGAFSPDSNILFGEGGAGTFSDGKLTTGIKDRRCSWVTEQLVEFGAPPEALYLAKPHIGTDMLRGVVRRIRERIVELGGEVRFSSRLSDLIIKDGALHAVRVSSAEGEYELGCEALILACGHSARDTYEMLKARNVAMKQKPFSIGARIEHRQSMINVAQYGRAGADPATLKILGAAEYKLSRQLKSGRGVYTFCMCPGGQVVCSSSEEGMVATNGMSLHARDGENANSALLVSVNPGDFGSDDVLAGVEFQRRYERAAFLAGGGDYRAPAQRVEDFLKNRASRRFGDVTPSYMPGVRPANLSAVLPDFAFESMREALPQMGRLLRGFDHPDAVLTGVETRSSAPVRIERGADGCANIGGLYPTGEGAGWAGGIMSAAVDGIRQAQRILGINE